MRAIRIAQPGDIRLVDLPGPHPGPGEVVVSVAYSGICGSDVDIFVGKRPPGFVAYPVTPGHEWSGTVAAVGESVDASLIGKSVVGRGFRSCHHCQPCLRGEPALCETAYDEIGFTRPGSWAEKLLIPAEQLHLLDDDTDLRLAACLEPAACAADAVQRAAVATGDRVAVIGAGTIGLLIVQLLAGAAPAELLVIEPDERAASIALQSGATAAIRPASAAARAGRFDVVIEASGASGTGQASLDLVRRGGRIVLVGIPGPEDTLMVGQIVSRKTEIQTVFGAPREAWGAAIAALAAGRLRPQELITHEFDLAEAEAALHLLQSSPGTGKILLKP